jgi:hypothetical protein
MIERDHVRESLEEQVPLRLEARPEWAELLARAGVEAETPQRRWLRPLAAGFAVAAFATVAVLLSSPFGDEPAVLERARAAVGTGPVLHVVLRDDWGGVVVDLRTGASSPAHGERDVWYDPARGLHEVSRFGGVVQDDALFAPGKLPQHEAKIFGLLGDGYPQALASGHARNLGPGEAYGIPVYWIRVDAQLLPDVADGKQHQWAHDVGISRRSYEPVAIRETRDDISEPGTGDRILAIDRLPAGGGNFAPPRPNSLDREAMRKARDPISVEQAQDALGRRPFWLGSSFTGQPLTQVARETTTTGHQTQTIVTGRLAAEVKACAASVRRTGIRSAAACEHMRRAGRALLVRGDHVYELGPVVWGEHHPGLVLGYGTLPAGGRPADKPFVLVTETTSSDPRFTPGATAMPPEGSVFLSGPSARLRKDGVYLSILASSRELALAAARGLAPMP